MNNLLVNYVIISYWLVINSLLINYITQIETGTEGFSGKIGPRDRQHNERDHRSRSLCRRPKGPISTKARSTSLYLL